MHFNKQLIDKLLLKRNITTSILLKDHELINTKYLYKNNEYIIRDVFKIWNYGYYIGIGVISCDNPEIYKVIPYENINSENEEIISILNCLKNKSM